MNNAEKRNGISRSSGAPSGDIYGKFPTSEEIYSVYLYFLKPTRGGVDVTAYFYLDLNSKIELHYLMKIVAEIATSARKGDYGYPDCGKGFDAVPRRRKSYIVLVAGDKNLKLKKKKDGGPIKIYRARSATNHTFFDGMDFDLDIPKGKEKEYIVSAFACINHMVSQKDGTDLDEGESESFEFVLNAVGKRRFGKRDDDSGGTNQGQPLGPPYH